MKKLGLLVSDLHSNKTKTLVCAVKNYCFQHEMQLFVYIVHLYDASIGVYNYQHSACKALATSNNIDLLLTAEEAQKELNIQLEEEEQNTEGAYFLLRNQMFQYQYFLQDLQATDETERIKALIIQHYKKFGITSCICCIYDNPKIYRQNEEFVPSDSALVFFAYNEETTFDETAAIILNPKQNLYPKDFAFSVGKEIIVTALFNHKYQYGYIAYTPGNFDYSIYELATITTGLSLATNRFFTRKMQETILLEQEKKTLETKTYYDEMTGTLNRRGLFKYALPLMQSAVERNLSGGVIFGDMDRLKYINDTFGHDAGDRAIKGEVQILKSVFRTQDIIARLGGDEFVIVADGLKEQTFEKIKDRINKASQAYNKENNEEFSISISLGYVEFNKKNFDLSLLIKIADERQYQEKLRHHKNRT